MQFLYLMFFFKLHSQKGQYSHLTDNFSPHAGQGVFNVSLQIGHTLK